MDDSLFRQKPANQIPRGQEQQAVDANPSPQPARIGTPVWRSFVANKEFQENNKAAIAAEQQQMRESRRETAQPIFRGAAGKLIRKVGRMTEELNPEEWANDPVAGPEARKSLWDGEIRTLKKQAEDDSFQLRDPSFHAKSLSDKERQDMLAEGGVLQESDPRHAELKAKLAADDEYRATKTTLAQRAFDAEKRARELEGVHPDDWWQSRTAPKPSEQRAAVVAQAQAERADAAAAENDAATNQKQLEAELAAGATGARSQEIKSELAEIAAGRGKIAEVAAKAEEPIKAEQEKAKDFFRVGDTISGIWDAVKGLGVTAPSAFYQLVEGMERPDQYSDSAKAAFAEADAFNREMQAKTAANQAAGTSSSVGESFREAGGSLGFSLGSMAAAIPASIAGAKAGAATGGIIGAAAGSPAAGVGAAPGAGVGAAIGGTIGGVTAGMAASGTAAYRMAGASFLNEAFQTINAESVRKNGRPMNEQEMASAYEALLPIAKNTALWEAGPEAVGNAVTLGAGKIIFGLGKPLMTKFMATAGGKAAVKVGAGAGALATELAGETVTNVEQSADQKKADAIAKGQDPNAIKADWSSGAVVESFKEVAPQTLALMAMMGGAGAAIKGGAMAADKLRGGSGEADPIETVAAELATIDPEAAPPAPEEVADAEKIAPNSIAQGVLIERELKEIEAQDRTAYDDAQVAVDEAVATGDTKAIKAAEEARDKLPLRARTVRAVLKIAAGKQLDDLTRAELDSIGAKEENGGFEPMTDEELKKAGLTKHLIRDGADGSIILRDEALDAVKAISPRARSLVKMTEDEALKKAKERTMSEWDVPMRDGTMQRVRANSPEMAEREAAGMFEAGTNAVLPGRAVQVQPQAINEQDAQGPAQDQGQPQAQVPLPEVPVGETPPANTVAPGGVLAGTGDAQAQGEVAVAPPAATTDKESLTVAPAETPAETPADITTRNRRRFPDEDRSIEAKVNRAINNYEDAGPRWQQLQSTGATDQQISDEIARQFGHHGSSVHGGYMAKGTSLSTEGQNPKTIKGKELVKMVRDLMQIPEPAAKPKAKAIPTPAPKPKADDTTTRATIRAKATIAKLKKNKRINIEETTGATQAVAGKIQVNAAAIINKALEKGMTDEQAGQYFDMVMDEEVRHLAQFDAAETLWKLAKSPGDFDAWMHAHYATIWQNDFLATGKADDVKNSYGMLDQGVRSDWKSLPDWQKAMEGIRIMSQTNPTENAKLWLNISDTLKQAIRAALASLKKFRTPALETEIANLENALRQLTDTNPDSKKPTASKAGDGNRKPTKTGGDSKPSGNGKAVPPRRDGTGSPVVVGSRVEFERDGRKLTGIVTLKTDAAVRVRPDEDPAMSFGVPIGGVRVIDIQGPKINGEWTAFAPESGTLGIPRAMMPQIKSGDRSALVQFLKARGVDYAEESVPASSLKPTQTEFSPAKVAKAKAFEGGNRSILISSDNHVLDGHHQWLAARDKGEDIAVIRLDSPIRELLPMAMTMPSVTVDGGKILEAPAPNNETKPEKPLISGDEIKVEPTLSEADQALLDAMEGLYTSPLSSRDLIDFIKSSFSGKSSDYKFEPSNENDPDITRIASEQGIQIVSSENLQDSQRGFEERTGARPVFFAGGDPETKGFIEASAPSLIFVNAENQEAISWTLIHELIHVSQRDRDAGSVEAYDQIIDKYIDDKTYFALQKILLDAGYNPQEVAEEIQAYVFTDVISGKSELQLDQLPEYNQIRVAIYAYVNGLRGLNPLVIKPTLFTSPLTESFTDSVPSDRIGPLVNVATKYLADGVNTPEALAERLKMLADGRMRRFSQSIWFAFKMAGVEGVDRPDWKGIYSKDESGLPVDEGDSGVGVGGIPSLGTTGKAIWQGWKALTGPKVASRAVIEARDVNNGGIYGWVNGELMRLQKTKSGRNTIATMTPATKAEIEGIHESIDRGALQIEARRITGAGGEWSSEDAGALVEVIHQATGQPIAEFLETPEGKAWQKRMDEAVAKATGTSEQEPVEVAAENQPPGEVVPESPVVETPVEAAAEVKGEMVNPANRRPAKEIKAEIIQRVEEEIAKLPKLKVDEYVNEFQRGIAEQQIIQDRGEPRFASFQIPGDGRFRIRRTTTDLTDLLARVKRMGVGTPKDTKYPRRFFAAQITRDTPETALEARDTILLGLQDPDYRKQLVRRMGEEKLTGLEDVILRQEGVTREELNGETPAPVETVEAPAEASVTPKKDPKPSDRIEDFGEKILGARKDLWGKFKTAIEQDLPSDVADMAISKSLPEPDYEAAIAQGISVDSLATYKAIRDSIPSKPRVSYKLDRWATMFRGVHPLMQKLATGAELTGPEIEAASKLLRTSFRSLGDKINFYRDLGFPAFQKGDDWRIVDGVSVFFENGVKLEKPVTKTIAYSKGRFTDIESRNNDREGYIEVLDKVRARIISQMEKPAESASRDTKFSIYADRLTKDVFIGKKAVNGVIRLKSGFSNSKFARQYLEDNQAALEEQWKGLGAKPDYRRQVNAPRQGPIRREGDATPEQFQEAFGFRGVQFGNWVEGDRRQVDINEAFDAFMDLAEALQIPPRAVSLDGSLGLAFGARGRAGAAAHYEPGEVVINLTKMAGPGSLAHEWFHAFDNYFARLDKTGETKAKAMDAFATTGTGAPKNMRPEVWQAFKNIRSVLAAGPFAERSKKLDDTKSKPYYQTTIEKAARAFERYTVEKLEGREISNDYLVNIVKDFDPALPTAEEMAAGIRESFDKLFNVIEAKDTERGTALQTSPLSEENDTFKRRIKVDPALTTNSKEQQALFGKNVASGKLAGFGNRQSRLEQDVVDAEYEFRKVVKTNADAARAARARLKENPEEIENKLLRMAMGEDVQTDAADQLAFQYLIDQKSAAAGDNAAKHAENAKLRMAYRLQRGDIARELQIGYDRSMSPEERAQAALTEAIYTPSRKVQEYAKKLSGKKRLDYLAEESAKRIAEVEVQLRKMNTTLAQVTGKNQKLQLENTRLGEELLKTRNVMEADIIKAVRNGWTMPDIQRRWGKLGAEQAMPIITKARQELYDRISEMSKSGMTRDQILEKIKQGLATSPLGASNGMTPEEIWGMIENDLGIPAVIPTTRPTTSKPKPQKTPKAPNVNQFTANWSRPDFTDGLKAYTFDTKDREGIMERVEIIRGLAGAVGKIDALTGGQRTQALRKLQEINAILAKYGTDATEIFNSSKGIEDYRFDMSDIAQVAAVSRAISMMDADIVDKASEWLYFSMLSGLQTMLVNATAIVPAAWESTVGKGVEMAINSVIRNPMGAQFGEEKYVLRALGPAITRAMSNARTAFAAQHPMFDRDVMAQEVDLERIMGGKGYRVGGSIAGKWGDRIRVPMRILSATDDFNTTLMACCEVGAFAYRVGVSKGMKPGSAELDKFIRQEVNTPGSFSYQLAAVRAKNAIFSNPLPGQTDPVTGKKVPVSDIGDAVGYVAGKITETFAKEHDNLFVKSFFAAMRISFFPFQRTPFNILRKGIRYTLNPFSMFDIALGVTRNARNDGKWDWKITGNDAIAMERRMERANLITRAGMQLQGGMLMLLVAGLGEGDEDDQDKPLLITGSAPFTPRGMAERQTAMDSGMGPYRISFRRADGSERFGFNYGKIEPLATTLAASIDIMKQIKRANRSGKDIEGVAAAALGGFVAQAQDKSFLRGIGDLISLSTNAIAEPDLKENRKMQQFVASRVAMAVPNIIKQPIRELDSNFRERSESFMEELLYQVAPAGQKSASVNPFGETVEKTGNPAARIIDVTDAGTNKVNPIASMLLRYRDKHPDKAWFPSAIRNASYKDPRTGKEVEMTADQLAEFRSLAGRRATALLKSLKLNTSNPTERDIEMVKKAFTDSRSAVKKALVAKYSR